MFGGGLLGIIFFGLIIYAIFTLITAPGSMKIGITGEMTPWRFLTKKYARGEISDEEYVRKKAMLLNA
ncbi:SHOCT domain-containing protein [Biomaibacter acetigenes]|uniref:SHOCT domain-containing protein n=2 Tax=Biomaibacter acetigenes TaxID=2316383 RepID=A0A3G2R6I6_9FIRM|nr:SHOCT domain-containing protein [Biomaibacter acetigenes]